MPVLDSATSETLGELECLFAIGTKKQIENLRATEIQTKNPENEVICIASKNLVKNEKKKNIVDLLNLLHTSLNSSASVIEKTQSGTNMTENCSFKFLLEIKSARNLSSSPNSKINRKLHQLESEKESHLINSEIGEQPSSYVTFQGKEDEGAMVKSHEGMVHSTVVIEKTCNPVWNASFYVSCPLKYLINVS